MPRSLFVAVAVVLLGIGVLGGVALADGTPMSPKQWRKAANALCEDRAEAQADLAADVFGDVPEDGQPSLEQMTAFVEQLEPVVQQSIDDIDALAEPKSLRKKVRKLLKLAQADLDRLVADPSIGLEGNPFTDTELRAAKLHLDTCAGASA
jgi:hypothetical protein